MQNTYHEIRKSFKSYFKQNEHKIIQSSNLVPTDPSLLFVNSGMVQFKDIFTGIEKTDLKRATTIQKCIRAGGKHNDLENVGFTNRHHTFFEMLGNFSFGDYFKEEAIYFAWKFLTTEIGLLPESLYITVFHEDEEAFKIWKNLTGFSESKIIKIKTQDNFWSMGPCGPCGPSSEIFYDYGSKIKGGLPGTAEQDGARYTEIWNLVFMEFNQINENKRELLKTRGIDTGMGLERLVSVIEGKTDNYETSLFQELIAYSHKIIGKAKQNDTVYRILADHARSIAFLIADGVHPSSEGRGYILRRIIRRALRHLYMASYKGGDLNKITAKVIDLMATDYSELTDSSNLISSITQDEEEKFMSTLPVGMRFLENEMKQISKGEGLNPEKAFMLYDTFGFPLDITNDILKSNNLLEVDCKDFEEQMSIQKERSKKSWKGSGDQSLNKDLIEFASSIKGSTFQGYEKTEMEAKILGIFENFVILNHTCFYPEGGGQISDIGFLNNIAVEDVFNIKDTIIHKLNSTIDLKVGDIVKLNVSIKDRKSSANAHSATHLLHHFLREKFGKSVVQKGSLVERNRLRFDFSLNKPLTSEEIYDIEFLVNTEIAKGINPEVTITNLEEAKQNGAIAFFGEKYGEKVRTLKIGKSFELCGGIHVENTAQICAFKIIQETSVASGVRRIEAITGENALQYMIYLGYNVETLRSQFKLSKTSSSYESKVAFLDDAVKEVFDMQKQITSQAKEIMNLKLELALANKGTQEGDFYIKCVEGLAPNLSKQLALKLKKQSKVVILFASYQGACMLYVISNEKTLNALEIGKKVNHTLQGKGGGSAEFANFGSIKQIYKESDILKLIKS